MPNSAHVTIVKANGVREPFNPEKLHRSLTRSGAQNDLADTITTAITQSLGGGETTKQIYARAFAQLRNAARPSAARYSLKRALFELGPSGYAFEDFLAELYKARGYRTQTRHTLRGKCATHELDLCATNGTEYMAAEAKFHNSAGTKSDLKVALYVRARFEDLKDSPLCEEQGVLTHPYLITNTKFTSEAESYATCVGLSLISWDYPATENLRTMIEDAAVHPLSCLTTLSTAHKRALMADGIVLCRHLRNTTEKLRALGLSEQDIARTLEEARQICVPLPHTVRN